MDIIKLEIQRKNFGNGSAEDTISLYTWYRYITPEIEANSHSTI